MAGALIIISILILIIVLGVLAIIMAKDRRKAGPDYYIMFLISIVWVPIGLIMQWKNGESMFWVIGLFFLFISIWHKDKWKKNHTPFNKLNKKQKRFAMVVLLILTLILLMGLVIVYLKSKNMI